MSPITQIRARIKKTAQNLTSAKRREAKADANARKAGNELVAARQEVKSVEAEQARLAQILKLEEGVPAPKGKPGPKPKVQVQVEGRKKPGPKPKAAANQSRAAQGRREVASGKRQPIKEVISKVLGKRVMNANTVYESIKERHQLPNSGDPRGYIGYLLSASKVTITRGGKEVEVPLFERVPEKGRGFYKNRGVSVSKTAAPATAPKATKPPKLAKKAAAKPVKAAAPTKNGKRTVTCSKCGNTGHNAKGHDKAVATKAEPKAAKVKAVKAKAAPKTGKKQSTCKTCGQPGHNARGHEKFVAKAAASKNGTAGPAKAAPVKAPAKAAPVKAAPVKADGKRQNKCGKCGAFGHNAKGHDKAVAAAGKTNGTTTHAKPEPKAEVEEKIETKPETKPEPEPKAKVKAEKNQSTDDLLKEAGIDIELPAAASPS